MTTPALGTSVPSADDDRATWWRSAVTYQLYIRSFADGDGDGLGDVAGIRSRLPYLASLGVDAIWINPWYPSPQADGGYDVSDYRTLDPVFGDLAAGQALIDDAHRLGLRVILDVVPNHTSDEHPWFQAALAGGPDAPERSRYIFRPGRGTDGSLPPNDWRSVFGGSAWQRVTEPDGTPGEWYLHLFDVKQPDLDWSSPEVRAEFRDVLRFWFDRGADGFRIDVAHGLVKDPALPDLGLDTEVILSQPDRADHPHWDRPGVHEIWREWRAVADEYDPPRTFVAEAWVASSDRLADYLRPDELHSAFDFELVRAPWHARELRRTISTSLAAHDTVGAPVTWVLSNHDITRHVTRYGRAIRAGEPPLHHEEVSGAPGDDPLHGGGGPVDVALGTRRARAALLMELALPGAVYLFQGEELGLPEVEDLPEDVLQDPVWERSGHTQRGRDGCRVPIPWTRSGPSLGFGSGPGWLPQPPDWSELSAEAQEADRSSMLWLYREALQLRRELPMLGDSTAPMRWVDSGNDVVAFTRGDSFTCIVNAGPSPVALPRGHVVLASGPVDGELPPDTAAWVVTA